MLEFALEFADFVLETFFLFVFWSDHARETAVESIFEDFVMLNLADLLSFPVYLFVKISFAVLDRESEGGYCHNQGQYGNE